MKEKHSTSHLAIPLGWSEAENKQFSIELFRGAGGMFGVQGEKTPEL